jgi:hypothetical protein
VVWMDRFVIGSELLDEITNQEGRKRKSGWQI